MPAGTDVDGGRPMAYGERFEVHTDRAALRRFIRRMTWWTVGAGVMMAVVVGAGLGLAFSVGGGVGGSIAGGAVAALFGYFNGYTAHTGALSRLRRRVELDRVLVVDAGGIWMPVQGSVAGSVTLPWSAVGEVDVRRVLWRRVIVRIRLRPGVTPAHPGAVGLGDPVTWPVAQRRGLHLGTGFTDTDADTVVAAIQWFRAVALR